MARFYYGPMNAEPDKNQKTELIASEVMRGGKLLVNTSVLGTVL